MGRVGGEREERERARTHQCERETSINPRPDHGPNLQPFGLQDDAPTNGATPARAVSPFLKPPFSQKLGGSDFDF